VQWVECPTLGIASMGEIIDEAIELHLEIQSQMASRRAIRVDGEIRGALMTDLKNAVVLITGAHGGFGQQFIRQCLQAGCHLILTDLDQAALEETASRICHEVGSGSIRQCIAADLATPDGVEAFVSAVQQTPDILINNAGIGMSGRFDEIPLEQWERLMQVNLLAPMRLTARFMPEMIRRRSGHIVNISSMAGWIGTEGLAPYSASKYGLRGFGEALREELSPYGVQVTNVYPFFSRTPILDSPRYGSMKERTLPDSMTSDPADVIRATLDGVRHNKADVFPDPTARRLHWIKRLAPGFIPFLNRHFSGGNR
jgi:short-subunit dehydrogenase